MNFPYKDYKPDRDLIATVVLICVKTCCTIHTRQFSIYCQNVLPYYRKLTLVLNKVFEINAN